MCVAVNSRLMTIDEAKKKRGKFVSDEEFEKMVEERSKELYGDLRTLEFSWKKQEDSETGKVEMKLMSRLPNGKLVCYMRENSRMGWPGLKSFSSDDGLTWDGPYQTLIQGCHRPVAGFLSQLFATRVVQSELPGTVP